MRLLLVLLMLIPTGCTTLREYVRNGFKVGPNYRRPAAPIASSWIDGGDDPRILPYDPDDAHWWRVLNDPVLEGLVQSAYSQNLTLKEAGFRVLAARAELAIAIGSVFPQSQTAGVQYVRKGLSHTIANFQFTPQRWFNIYDLGFNLSWELDLWGKLRRGIEAQNDVLDATIEDYDGVLVTLIADVARTYTEIRTLESEIRYTRRNIELQTGTLKIVEERFEGGVVSKLDVTQATLNLADTEAKLPTLKLQLRRANDRLCTLLGIPMEDLVRKLGSGGIPAAGPDVAVGIPAELIRRRPDVRAAERRLAAQSARIGIADAQMYPSLAISGSIGYQTGMFDDLFNDQSIVGSWGPSLQWNILNYGRLLNNVRVQDARFQELAMAYFNNVLSANEEAENALAAFLQFQEVVKELVKAEKAARESVEIALVQYTEGKVDYIRVFLAERELTFQQDALARARGEVAKGLIDIYRALGGGWQMRCRPDDGAMVMTPDQPMTPAEQTPTPRELPDIEAPLPGGTIVSP